MTTTCIGNITLVEDVIIISSIHRNRIIECIMGKGIPYYNIIIINIIPRISLHIQLEVLTMCFRYRKLILDLKRIFSNLSAVKLTNLRYQCTIMIVLITETGNLTKITFSTPFFIKNGCRRITCNFSCRLAL